jgi:UDP-2,3-diacylglucosamine hydrolase
MKYYFLSDAHLLEPSDTNYQKLLTFLQSREEESCSIYFLGDIFHFWVGYRHAVFSTYIPILQQLQRLRLNNIDLCFFEGNHDFHMGEFFREKLGCRVIEGSATLEVGGRRIFATHGDLMDESDRSYRMLRKFLRSVPSHWIIRHLHPDRTWNIALWASRQSQKKQAARKNWDPETMLTRHASLRFAENHDAVLTGHIHFPWHQETDQGTIISLGDWINQFTYAVLEDGSFSLESF